MTAKIRFALVGTSGIAHAHVAAVKKNHHAELTSIYSRSHNRAKHWADCYGLKAARHFEDVLTDRNIDAIIIATEPARHLDYSFLALEAGKHILIEKPIDLNLEKAISFLQQARDYKNIVTVVSQQRFDPGFIALRNNLLNGAVGRPILASLELYWNRTTHYYQEGTKWRGEYGSVLLNQGIHWIDLALWTFGNPHRVSGFSKSTRKELLCSDTSIACIEFLNGLLLSLQCSTAIQSRIATRFSVRGTKGHVTWPSAFLRPDGYLKRGYDFIYRNKSNLEKQLDHFVCCIIQGEEPLVSVEDAVTALKVANICEECQDTTLFGRVL